MKMKSKGLLVAFAIIWTSFYGQMESYEYYRELQETTDEWHKVELPKDLFGKVRQDLSDIRVFGITKEQDTIEAPYILDVASSQRALLPVPVQKLNETKNEKGYFYTFYNSKLLQISTIQLDFNKKNFDWKLRLEGSHDQKEWFTIQDDYRILSFENKDVDYKYTKILFAPTKYSYYRILIPGKEDPKLREASVYSQALIGEGSYIEYAIRDKNIREKKKERNTELLFDLVRPSRISYIQIQPKDTFDYYRPVAIEYLSDSIKTENGWKYAYKNLTNGILSSMESNEFIMASTTIKKIKITIYNGDNEPLRFGDFKLQGFKHELKVRFTKPARYFLTYGNESGRKSNYDIHKFKNNIPTSLSALELGEEQKIKKKIPASVQPLFENKLWLWLVMGVVILLLGGFSLKMMSQKK